MQITDKKSIANIAINIVFLIVLNFAMMLLLGYLTLDTNATLNSKIAAYFLAFLMPFFVVYKTRKMSGLERFLKFGIGFVAYIILGIIIMGFPYSFMSGLLPVLTIAAATMFFGNDFLDKP